jgi:hypothetical protein
MVFDRGFETYNLQQAFFGYTMSVENHLPILQL